MTKPPTSAELANLTDLGTVLEFVIELDGRRRVWRWSRSLPRLVAPDDRTLLIVLGGRRLGGAVGSAEAAELRARWTGRPPTGAYRLELPDVGRARWREVGRAVRTDYRSNKWTRGRATVDYTHDHGRGVRVWARGNLEAGAGLLCARGGKLRITARGIVG